MDINEVDLQISLGYSRDPPASSSPLHYQCSALNVGCARDPCAAGTSSRPS